MPLQFTSIMDEGVQIGINLPAVIE